MPPQTHVTAPDAEFDRLYSLEPEGFVAARTAAARALRRAGRRDEAAAVEALRKPSVAAWIVNRLARDEAGPLAALLEAGAHLREVQLAAGSARDLRAAVEAEAAALEVLMRAAGPLAARSGAGGEAALRHARETLHAAALDPAAAEDVRAGVVVKEAQAVGFPLGLSVPPDRVRERRTPPKSARPRPRTQPAAGGSRAEAAAAKRRQKAEADAARANDELAAAAAELEEAQDELAAAERALKQAGARERAARRAHAAAAARAQKAAERVSEGAG